MAIMLYFADIDAAKAPDQLLRAMLTPAEQARGRLMAEPMIRRRWAVGRALLRSLIGLSDGTIDLATTPNGKPFLENGPHFSLATSGNLMLVGVCREAPIGVDIELIRDVAFPDNWPAVYPALAAMRRAEHSDDGSAVRFLRAWTRLEAVTKRDGGRLGRALEPLAQPVSASHDVGAVTDVEIGNNAIAAVASIDQEEIALHPITPDDILSKR